MPRRHRLKHIDPDFPLSDREAIEISNLVARRQLKAKNGRYWRMFGWLWMLLLFVIPAVLVVQNLSIDCAVITAVLVFVACGVLLHLLIRESHAKRIRGELRRRGHDICVPCGYWLRGLGDDVKICPECGALREPMPAVKDQPS